MKYFLPLIASNKDFWRGRFILKTWIDSNLQSEAAYNGYQMIAILLLLIGQPIITRSLVDNWPIEMQRHPSLLKLNLYIWSFISLISFRLWKILNIRQASFMKRAVFGCWGHWFDNFVNKKSPTSLLGPVFSYENFLII